MRFTKTIASASVAAVLGIAGVSVAGATSSSGSSAPTAAPGVSATAATQKARPAIVRRRLRRAGVKLAAKTIGILPADLVKELRAGKTIAAVATAHGVQPQAVIDALKAAATAKIEAAKAAGKITTERAVRLQHRFDVAIPKFVNDWHPRSAS
jgi:uncharacterized protein (DUF433 family)